MKWYLTGIVALLCLATPLIVNASTPKEAIQGEVDAVLQILGNKALSGETGFKVKRERIDAAATKLFDFGELSKRSLGLYWNRFSPEQQKEFVNLYRGLLEDVYVDRITAYTNEKIDFTKEVPL